MPKNETGKVSLMVHREMMAVYFCRIGSVLWGMVQKNGGYSAPRVVFRTLGDTISTVEGGNC